MLASVLLMAQWTRDPGRRGGRAGVPDWERDVELPNDTFTFARVQYGGYGRGFRGGGWRTDFPNADLNFSYRLEQLTAMKVDPDGTVVDLSNDKLKQMPFVYITCLLYTSPSPRDATLSRMPSSA